MFFIIQPLFLQKTKPLYPTPKYLNLGRVSEVSELEQAMHNRASESLLIQFGDS